MASNLAPGAILGLSEAEAQQRVARLSIGANVLLVAIKIGAGLASHSLSVLAEGIQSLLDIFASTLILYAVRAAADVLEGMVADDLWPLPTYQEMLYIL